MLKQLKTIFLQAGLTAEDFQVVKQEAYYYNYQVFRLGAGICCIIFSLLLLSSHYVSALANFTMAYQCMALLSLAFFVLGKLTQGKGSRLHNCLLYAMLFCIYNFAIYVGTYGQPNFPATTFIVLLFSIPFLILDRPYRLLMLLTSECSIFCYCVWKAKTYEVAIIDTTNAFAYFLIAVFIDYYLLNQKLQHMVERTYIEHERDTDGLTGVLNRTAFNAQIHNYMKHPHAVGFLLMIDLDNFKYVNDSFGHATGDKVLRALTDCLRAVFRSTDFIGRYGGDEFLVFMPGAQSLEIAELRASQILLKFPDSSILPNNNPVYCSIGIAQLTEEPIPYEELFQKADEALYIAKEKGRRQYNFYEEPK